MLLKRVMRMLRLSMFSVLVSCAAIFSIAFLNVGTETKDRTLANAVACIFWAGLLFGQIFFWTANSGRKKIQRKLAKSHVRCPRTIGLVTFGSSAEAVAADILLAVSAVAVLILVLFDIQVYWMVTLSLALLVLSVHYHCILNGKTYRYIKAFHLAKNKAESK